MVQTGDRLLTFGGVVTGAASVLHLAIIFGGADWYRFFGAGEHMAKLVARGSAYPTVVTSGIAVILGIWMLYAFSGAGLIRCLPLLRLALILIAAVYLIRGIFGVPLVLLMDNRYAHDLQAKMTFMIVSSAICICLGICYAWGAIVVWRKSFSPSA
jgi:hypothetical protein